VTFATEVTTRVSDQLLVELTNQGDDNSSTTVDATVLAAAVADAEAVFLDEVGVVADDTNARHVQAMIVGVVHELHAYTFRKTPRANEIRQEWERSLIRLARTLGNDRRVMPQTSSPLTPSTESSTAQPDQDRTRWRGFVIDAPGGSTEDTLARDD
jgi:hypothetical protein